MKQLLQFFSIVSLLLMSFSETEAQQVAISEGMRFTKNSTGEILGKTKSGEYLVLTYSIGSKVKLYRFDQKMIKILDREIDLGRRTNAFGAYLYNDEVYLYYRIKKDRRHKLMVNKYDIKGRLLNQKAFFEYPKFSNTPQMDWVASDNDRYFMMYDKTKSQEARILVYDMLGDSLTQNHLLNLSVQDYRNDFDFVDALVSDGGYGFLIFKENYFNYKREKNHFGIFRFGTNITLSKVSTANIVLSDVRFEIDQIHRTLALFGLYNKKNDIHSMGYCYASIDIESLKVTPVNKYPFSKEIILRMLEKKSTRAKALPNLVIVDLILRHDGGCLAVLEEERQEQQVNGDMSGMTGRSNVHTSVNYLNNKLLLLSFDKSAQLDWALPLLKKQYATSSEYVYTSVGLVKTPLAIKLVFNESIERDCTVGSYVIESDGSYDHESVMNTEDKDIRLMFSQSEQVGARELIVPSYMNRELKLVRIKFEKQ